MSDVLAPVLMSQAEYARYRGVSEARISTLKREGRLVMTGSMVNATESDKILPELKDETPTPPPTTQGEPGESGTAVSRAQLRKLEGEANLTELKLAREVGKVIDKEDTVAAVSLLYGELCEKLAGIGTRIAGRVVTLKTEREVATTITEALENELAAFALRLKNQFAAVMPADVPDESQTEAPADARVERGGDGDGAGADPGTPPDAE